eukprot:gene4704-20387_t
MPFLAERVAELGVTLERVLEQSGLLAVLPSLRSAGVETVEGLMRAETVGGLRGVVSPRRPLVTPMCSGKYAAAS